MGRSRGWRALVSTPRVPRCGILRTPERAISLSGARILIWSQGAWGLDGGGRRVQAGTMGFPPQAISLQGAKSRNLKRHLFHLLTSGMGPTELRVSNGRAEDPPVTFKMQIRVPTLA